MKTGLSYYIELQLNTTVEGNIKMSIVCYYGITKKDINTIVKKVLDHIKK
ncbi:hypothetical protein C672_2000 [[Clostridium] bifermentans ATCC 638]|uniref:Uncharacterized protein n=1 Tax=Paraclostridium bifermentans ATCC 638 = DSM 14991 TaxID=1233171 RepID=T4VQM1_PARBF|nr:hypothetical protein [Paraclostridium bifermentans]EQK43056.1 hypothetical protein C672_2000 [[Clostridium] bifermentans ATCC 638] [Paraclostridium bifermentans ATCC 638 = DSM 14991]UAG16929.1 hypothetical protein KXZ80_09020 [Paraclostridium bifermentans]